MVSSPSWPAEKSEYLRLMHNSGVVTMYELAALNSGSPTQTKAVRRLSLARRVRYRRSFGCCYSSVQGSSRYVITQHAL